MQGCISPVVYILFGQGKSRLDAGIRKEQDYQHRPNRPPPARWCTPFSPSSYLPSSDSSSKSIWLHLACLTSNLRCLLHRKVPFFCFICKMKCIKQGPDIAPGGAQFALRRYMFTNSKPPKSPSPKLGNFQPVSSRFQPAHTSMRVAIRNPPQPHRTAPMDKVPDWKILEIIHEVYTSTGTSHMKDVGSRGENLWRFAFPRRTCPKNTWWDSPNSADMKLSDLKWTSGQMHCGFWKRCRVALTFSGCLSSLFGGAGMVPLIICTNDPVPTSFCLSVFMALALPTFTYGIHRSRVLQEAWMGLVGARVRGNGDSMMPYIPSASSWQFLWWYRPLDIKAGDIIAFLSESSSNYHYRYR